MAKMDGFGPRVMPRFAAALVLGLVASSGAMAQGGMDPVATGVVRPADRIDRAAIGSMAFRVALAQLLDGDAAGAYAAARHFSDTIERRTIQWAAIRLGEGKIDYNTVARFVEDAPDFERAPVYKSRLERALVDADPGKDEIIRVLGGQMPILLDAQIALAAAYVEDGQKARAARIARSIWVNDFLDPKGEQKVLAALGPLLTQADFWDRAAHLLMHDRASATERIFDRLTPAQQTLAAARIAVSRKRGNAQELIDKVDPSLRNHPLYWFTRGQLANDKGDLGAAVDMLDNVKTNVPDAAEFWYERRTIARRALAVGNAELAYRAAAGYGDGPEGRVVDAQFHAGWIALSFLNDPGAAASHFKKMVSGSTLPDTITQSHYWLGRAVAAGSDQEEAAKNYRIAAEYDDLYYGQLAREALGRPAVEVRNLPEWRSNAAAFDNRQLVKAVRLLAANGQSSLAEALVNRLAYSLTAPGDFVLAARLAQEIGAHNLAVLVGDIADRRGIPLDLFHFPKDGIPSDARLGEVENAAVYAIARQESRFDVDAVSRSGARGLMQLMPGTAKEVAGKLGLAYSTGKLTSDPQYNLLLGSTYLATQMARYEGSLVLAAAAYNAGAGNVNKWLETFGDPRKSSVDPVVWIEAIPFAETRKYVQRVMANYMVYRSRLGRPAVTMLSALRRTPS